MAQALERRGIATLLFDLLTAEEEQIDRLDARLRFDIDLLARRLVGATRWIQREPAARDRPLAYFSASTGAAAALVAAAELGGAIAAVVSRGGRPDLAAAHLADVTAPSLLIVGGADLPVLLMNRDAAAHMTARRRVAVIPGATHLFEEPGALDQVVRLAGDWLVEHLGAAAARAPLAAEQPG